MITILKYLFGIKPETNNNIKILDASTFKQAVSKNKVQLIDVRTANEYNAGHIKKSKNLSLIHI